MDATEPFRLMALNNAWANARLYRAASELPDAEFIAPRPGFFPSLAATLDHIYMVDLYFLDALEAGGKGRTIFDRPPLTTCAALGEAQMKADMRLAQFCSALTSGELAKPIHIERRESVVAEKIGAVLLQQSQHQIHHRGQAHVQLQHAGIDPPQLDEFHLEHDRATDAEAYFL